MLFVVIYDNVSGRILQTTSTDADSIKGETRPWLEVSEHDASYWQTHFVKDGVLTECAVMPAVVTGLNITGIPNPAVLSIDGLPYDVTDGEAELSFEHPGTYQIRLESTGFLTSLFEVTV